MPNHIHGIIGIDNSLKKFSTVESLQCNDSTNQNDSIQPLHCNDSTSKDERMATISPKAGSISVMMRSYKSACTKEIKESNNFEFGWQSRFYDHIIRNQQSLINIENYIINNPLKWAEDENNPSNIV